RRARRRPRDARASAPAARRHQRHRHRAAHQPRPRPYRGRSSASGPRRGAGLSQPRTRPGDRQALVAPGRRPRVDLPPDRGAVSGAILREVGTTNITRLADYERAVGPNTGALLRVHASNYRVSGFTKAVPLTDLVELGRKHKVPVIDDIGSGALIDFARFGFH